MILTKDLSKILSKILLKILYNPNQDLIRFSMILTRILLLGSNKINDKDPIMILFHPITCSRRILSGYIPQTPTRYFQHPIIFNKKEIKHQKFHRKIFWIGGNVILSETILLYYQLSALISQLHVQSSSSSCLIFHRILLSPAESRTGSHRILSRIDQDSIGS